jgi:hypothetical protein
MISVALAFCASMICREAADLANVSQHTIGKRSKVIVVTNWQLYLEQWHQGNL